MTEPRDTTGGHRGASTGGGGGGGGAASFKHTVEGSERRVNAMSSTTVNGADEHGGNQPGAGGVHGGAAGMAGRVVVVMEGKPHVFDKAGQHTFVC